MSLLVKMCVTEALCGVGQTLHHDLLPLIQRLDSNPRELVIVRLARIR